MPVAPAPAYRVPLFNRLARPLLKAALRGIFHLLAEVHIIGRENIPTKPYIVAMNHVSLYDPPFILSFWPEMIESMGASDIWKKPGQNILVRLYHAIPVHRGEYDRRLIDQVLSALSSGHALLIAPEGGRTHVTAMRQAKPGLAQIVDAARVPVVPVGIVGTTSDFWQRARRGERPHLELHIGKPIELPPLEGRGETRRAARQHNTDLVMAHIARLLPEEYRGYYAESASSLD